MIYVDTSACGVSVARGGSAGGGKCKRTRGGVNNSKQGGCFTNHAVSYGDGDIVPLTTEDHDDQRSISHIMLLILRGSVTEWLACWTQAQQGLGSNRSRDAVGQQS